MSKKRPKVKGCYECSRRRIDCDRGEPECEKCRLRGLKCSGLGIRVRFTDGLKYAAVRKNNPSVGSDQTLQDGQTRDLDSSSESTSSPQPARSSPTFKSVNISAAEKYRKTLPSRHSSLPEPLSRSSSQESNQVLHHARTRSESHEPGFAHGYIVAFQKPSNSAEFDADAVYDEDEQLDPLNNNRDTYTNSLTILPYVDHIDHSKRTLLKYFSSHVAPIMAVIDRGFNFYRDIVLPYSESDDLVLNGLLNVAVSHLTLRRHPETVHRLSPFNDDDDHTGNPYYSLVLRELVKRSFQDAKVVACDQSSLIAVVLLLYTEMITGGKGFEKVYKVFRTLGRIYQQQQIQSHQQTHRPDLNELAMISKNQPSSGGFKFGFDQSDLGRYLEQQTNKFQLYAEPLLSEESGLQFISQHFDASLEYMRFCGSCHPEYAVIVQGLTDLMQQARSIYVLRAANLVPVTETVPLVETFILRAEKLMADARAVHALTGADQDGLQTADGEVVYEHVLVSCYFFVAAESSTPEHRAWFAEKLERLWRLTGFANSLKGVDQLKLMWRLQKTTRWTTLLGGPGQVLIG